MAIRITNLQPDQVLNHPLALICGDVQGTDNIVSIAVQNITDENSNSAAWPVVGRHFRALVHLASGRNVIRLSCYKFTHDFSLCYLSLNQQLEKYVRLVYVVCSDDFEEGRIQGPVDQDCSVESACNRISLGAQILQTTVAETLVSAGFPRKTFRLEESGKDRPITRVFKTSLSSTQLHTMSGEDAWRFLTYELTTSSLADTSRVKFLVFLSCTRYSGGATEPTTHSEILSRTKGHVMIGGGDVALCGTGCLYTWAENLDELPRRMTDLRKVDRRSFMDDSNYRGTRWACYSSSLGGVLHELGHVLDLAHTEKGIMGQGFHDLQQLCIASHNDSLLKAGGDDNPEENLTISASWTLKPKDCCVAQLHNIVSMSLASPSEQISASDGSSEKKKLRLTKLRPKYRSMYIAPEKEITAKSSCGLFWSKSCATILSCHKWLNPDVPSALQTPQFDGRQFTSRYGIRLIEFRQPESSTVIHFWDFPEGREEVPCSDCDLRPLLVSDQRDTSKAKEGSRKLDLLVIDTCGNILKGQLAVQISAESAEVP
ncbi:uncharacterized protein LOC135370918 [Ornithodoros turicata]|uniref:uncharacterized protein LOC135370918 n=1 Tax=Ornithodoros turicata TaxID=34597 RepID=UPI0031388503